MATSDVTIANLALQKLGTPKRIAALDDPNSSNARSLNACYASLRDSEQRKNNWNFCIKRVSIGADAAQTVWGGWNRFALPNDYIKILRDDESGQEVDWTIEGGFIITSFASPLNIKYVARIVDPNAFDTLFIEAFACRLAMQTCKEITGSNELKKDIQAEYERAIGDAFTHDAIERPPAKDNEDDWVNARL